MVLPHVLGRVNFTQLPDGRTEATWRYDFTSRPALLRPVVDCLGVWLLGRDIRRRIAGFARGCGDPVVQAAIVEQADDGS